MKRYIKSSRCIEGGRATHRDDKHRKSYNSIKFSGWSSSKTAIYKQLTYVLDEMKQAAVNSLSVDSRKPIKDMIRKAISEAEAAEIKLQQYRRILEKLNHSQFDQQSLEHTIQQLENTSLSQEDLHTP